MTTSLKTRILTFGVSAAFITVATRVSANWPMFHGDAQRTGYTSVSGPSRLQEKWATSLGGPVVTSAVVDGAGNIFTGPVVQEGPGKPTYDIFGLSPDGAIRWRTKTKFVDHDLPSISTPALDGRGRMYVGAMDGFYALNTADGSIAWKAPSQKPVIQSPVIDPAGRIYETVDGKLTAFESDGSIAWQQPLATPRLSGGPALGRDGTVYAVSAQYGEDSYLVAYDAIGNEKWRTFVSQYFWPLSTPTVGPDGTIYTATESILAIRPDGTVKWTSQPAFGLNSVASIAVDPQNNLYYSAYVYAWKLSSTGTVVWSKILTTDGSNLGHTYGSLVVDGAGKLYLGMGDGKRHAIPIEKQLLRLSGATGATQSSFTFSQIPGMSSPALAGDGTLYIGSLDGKLHAFKAGV